MSQFTVLALGARVMRSFRPPLLLTVLQIALSLVILAPPPTVGQEEQQPGFVPYQVAIERIEELRQLILERRGALDRYADNYGREPLQAAAARHGVNENGLGYLGGTYLVWSDAARFYSVHAERLYESRRAINLAQSPVREEDLAYIERGMVVWLRVEPNVVPAMEEVVDARARRAKHLGDARSVHLDNRMYVDPDPAVRAALRRVYEEHRRLADSVPVREAEDRAKSFAHLRLFSALTADPAERLRLPEPEANAGDQPDSVDEPDTITIAEPDETACAEERAKREALVRELDRLHAQRLPEETLRDWANLLDQIRNAAKGTGADGKDVAKRIRDHVTIADRLREGLGGILGRIAEGVEKYTGSISEATEALDAIIEAMNEAADIIERADSGSARDQILQLKATIDAIRRRTPIGRVPGLAQLLDMQSQAIERIAGSTGIIEERMREYDRIAREIIDKPIYVRGRSNRERLADARAAAQERLDALDATIAAMGCDRPTRQGLCEPRRANVDTALASLLAQEQWRENAVLALRQGWAVALEAAQRAATEVADARGMFDIFQHKVLNRTPRTDPRDVEVWRAQAALWEERAREARQHLAVAEDEALKMRMLLERERQKYRDAVQRRLGLTNWTDEERLYLRHCTSQGWRVPRPV